MSNKIQVQKGISIPEHQGRPSKYPWRSMRVGESFLMPAETTDEARARHAQVASASSRTGRRFTARRVVAEGGVRVWRTK